MKAKLEFDLNEPDDQMAHLRCVKAEDMAVALWQIQSSMLKDNIDLHEEINNILDKNNINLDDLIE